MILPQHSDPVALPFSCILFDMDGTLVDSAKGVIESAASALAAVGVEVPDPAQLLTFVGPPMLDSFRSQLGLDEYLAQLALQHYRAAYASSGAFRAQLYDGITDLLLQLNLLQIPMAVATSKVEDQAIRMARQFGIESYFVDICGASDAAGRSHKAEVIAESLTRLQSLGVDVSNPLMVGDRIYDIEGAAVSGIPAVFAQWGYGSPEESAKAVSVASSPRKLISLLARFSWQRGHQPRF